MQCQQCAGYLFFKPLPDETFACCRIRNETVQDINLKKGVSPAIERYGLKGEACDEFHQKGKVLVLLENEFEVDPVRSAGEDFIIQALG